MCGLCSVDAGRTRLRSEHICTRSTSAGAPRMRGPHCAGTPPVRWQRPIARLVGRPRELGRSTPTVCSSQPKPGSQTRLDSLPRPIGFAQRNETTHTDRGSSRGCSSGLRGRGKCCGPPVRWAIHVRPLNKTSAESLGIDQIREEFTGNECGAVQMFPGRLLPPKAESFLV